MSTMRSGASLFIDVLAAAAWGLAAFFIAARLVSSPAGGVLGLGIFLSVMTFMLTARLQEHRAKALQENACPRCRSALRQSHEHRRWDTERSRWLAPLTAWECAGCGYGHEEPAPCSRCPEAA